MMRQTSVSIRAAARADLDNIERLLADADLPSAGVAAILDRSPADFLIAETGTHHDLVGVAGLEVCGTDALLRSVAVAAEWRDAGVGRDLVHRLVDVAESRNLNALYLLTLTAERYFPRFGFERIERAAVPSAVAQTDEFTTACPATATVMMKPLHARA
jgi:amino-acid N-acetyltransferase